MRVVLEVNVLKLLEDLAKNKDEAFAQILKEVTDESKRTDESLSFFFAGSSSSGHPDEQVLSDAEGRQ